MYKLIKYVWVIILILTVFGCENNSNEVDTNAAKTDSISKEKEENKAYGFDLDSFKVHKSVINPNEFLANILLKYHIDYPTIDKLIKESEPIFDVKKLAAGKNYTILCSKDSLGKAQCFIYEPNATEYIIFDLRDSVNVTKGKKEIETKIKSVNGVITSSLYKTLQDKEVNTVLAIKMANVYAWSIDFYRIQKYDWFNVVYEERFVEGKSIGIGKVLAANFSHVGKNVFAYYFEQDKGGDYFDENANSLRRAFLKSPLEYGRLTSGFTMKRFHPVQKRWKAHLGTDYAAPKGTPILATGDGKVIDSRYKAFNGNYVKIRHNSTYTTQYLHMSKRAVKTGDYVKQGDVIGYVGSTGLATGPHVCYRFWKNGNQVNHLNEDFPPSEPINEKYKKAFNAYKKQWKQKIETPPKDLPKTVS